jgi:hypothetical protein
MAAVPFGQEVKQGQLSVYVLNVDPKPLPFSSVPAPVGGVQGAMVSVASEDSETSGFTIVLKAKLASGKVVTETQTVKRLSSGWKYTPALFNIGRIGEVVSVTIEELKVFNSAEFIE